ncbi:MAG: alpha/beta hydrolase [Acetobacteraceae bacterium]|nr:alpha/beta hydrolase [Acetobacteraceae bacterium]
MHTHNTAPTQFVEAYGIRFAYRRFGKAGGVPIVLNQHFPGTMDHWDPAVTDGLAREREVILFNNAGVSTSSGEVPTTFEGVNEKVAPVQREVIGKWGTPQEKPFEYLKSIRQPTLVVNGHKDIIVYTVNSFILQQSIPDAQLILYPDASHGSIYQYPELFLAHVSLFLSGYGNGTGQVGAIEERPS